MENPFECLRKYPEERSAKNWPKRQTKKEKDNKDLRLYEKYKNKFIPIKAAITELDKTFVDYFSMVRGKVDERADSLTKLTDNLEEALWAVEIIKEKVMILESELRSAQICLPIEKE